MHLENSPMFLGETMARVYADAGKTFEKLNMLYLKIEKNVRLRLVHAYNFGLPRQYITGSGTVRARAHAQAQAGSGRFRQAGRQAQSQDYRFFHLAWYVLYTVCMCMWAQVGKAS